MNLPIRIENGHGEILSFNEIIHEPDGDTIIGVNEVLPNAGPPMHVHWLQDEGFTVIKGKIGYQIMGGPEQFAGPGASVFFKRGVPHRFWNAGTEILQCRGWLKPANNIVFYLSAVFAAQKKNKNGRPGLVDMAFLLRKYRSEFDLPEIPGFVKKIILPVVFCWGQITGQYRKYRDAPAPIIDSN